VQRRREHVGRETRRGREVNRNREVRERRGVRSRQALGQRGERNRRFTSRDRARVRDFYRRHRGRFHRVARVSWPIVVGGFVPRSYTVWDIPDDFYGYFPGYEGYKYIVVGDQLLIIDPDTLEIVAIIPLY
jgi:hypothetical protein